MEAFGRSRRRFLAAVAFLTASVWALWKFLRPKTRSQQALLTVPIADIPENGALVYKEKRVALIRKSGEIKALGLVCTHLGCTVTATDSELVCPCHGSVFDWEGRIIKGPADRPLPSYKVEERDGKITVLL